MCRETLSRTLVVLSLFVSGATALAQDNDLLHQQLQQVDQELQLGLRSVGGATRHARATADKVRDLRLRLELLESRIERLDPEVAAPLRRKLHGLSSLVDNLERAGRRGAAPKLVQQRPAAAARVPADLKAAPVNDACEQAVEIGFGTCLGFTSEATNDGTASCGASLFSPDVWFEVVAPTSGTLHVDTLGSGYDTVLSVHTACPGTIANQRTCNDDAFGLQSAVSYYANAGESYWIRVSGVDGATGSFQLRVGTGSEISGRVTDAASGLGLPDISVALYDPQGDSVLSGTTDATGRYTLASLSVGTYFARAYEATWWGSYPLGYLGELYDELPCSSGCDPTTGTPIEVTSRSSVSGIDFSLDLGGVVTGTVTSAVGGGAVSGARVEVWSEGGSSYPRSDYTDDAGTFRVQGLATGTYFVTAESYDFRDELYDDLPCLGGAPYGCDPATGTPVPVTVAATTAGVDFVLEPMGTISGFVTEAATGEGIPSVGVEIRDTQGDWVEAGYTDVAGRYSIGGLADGSYFAVTATSGYLDEVYDDVPCSSPWQCATNGTPITATVGTVTTGIDFALARLGAVSGTVTHETTGEPIGSFWVRIVRADGDTIGSDSTDASGYYKVEGLLPGTYYAATNESEFVRELYDDVPCPGGVPDGCAATTGTPIEVSLDATTAGIDFAVVQLGAISGTVTAAATGEAASYVDIRAYDADGDHVGSAYSGYDGQYRLSGLPAGTYFVRTDDLQWLDELYDDQPCEPGCEVTAGTPIETSLDATASGIDFSLDRLGAISGIVTEAATGEPAGGLYVDVYDADGDRVGDGYVGSTGVYRVDELLPGTYFARTRNSWESDWQNELYDGLSCAVGCDVTAGTPIVVAANATTTGIDFSLERLGRIAGTVSGSGGVPIASSQVRVYNVAGSQVGYDYTDSEGRYVVRRLAPGTYFARTADHEEWRHEVYDDIVCAAGCDPTAGTPIPVALGATTGGIDFVLQRLGAISGLVTAEATGLPLANAEVQVWSATGSRVRSDGTDAIGRYQVEGLADGTYFVTARRDGYLGELYDGLPCHGGSPGCDPTAGTPVAVGLGATTTGVDFALSRLGSISGTLTDEATGLPLSSVRVEVWDTSGNRVSSTETGVSGLYSVSGLVAGAYFVIAESSVYLSELYDDQPCWRGPPDGCDPTTGTPIPVELGVETGGIDFALVRLGSISGTVTQEGTGGPLSSVSIRIWDAEGEEVLSSWSQSGSYVATGLITGTYYATASRYDYLAELYDDVPCYGGAPWGCDPTKGTPIAVVSGATTGGVDFDLASWFEGSGIAGTVREAVTGRPLAGVPVDVWNDSGYHQASVLTDADGTFAVEVGSGTYYASTDNRRGYVDEVFDDVLCRYGSAYAELCDPMAGTPIPVSWDQLTTGVDFDLAPGHVFSDGFESGDLSAWSGG